MGLADRRRREQQLMLDDDGCLLIPGRPRAASLPATAITQTVYALVKLVWSEVDGPSSLD